jgi:hypothetical protein
MPAPPVDAHSPLATTSPIVDAITAVTETLTVTRKLRGVITIAPTLKCWSSLYACMAATEAFTASYDAATLMVTHHPE